MDSLQHLLELSEFYGRVCGVLDCRDEEFMDDFSALMRIREIIAAYEFKMAENKGKV